MSHSRSRVTRALALCSVGVCLWLTASPAWAHAAYKDSDPADESTVSTPPGEIWAEFTEPPAEGSYLEVTDPCGTQVDQGNSSISGYRVYVSITPGAAGTYQVRFFVISSLDGHPTRGTFTFTATEGETCEGEPTEEEPEEEQQQQTTSGRSGSGSRSGPGPSRPGLQPAPSSERDTVASERSTERATRDRAPSRRETRAETSSETAREEQSLAAGPASSLIEGFTLEGVLIALAISLLIGAAGGWIYAGIMGPYK